MPFQLPKMPSRSEVGYLDPEVANEGQSVEYSEGTRVSFNPPPPKPSIPDLSGIKALAKYFNRAGFEPYPAWVYHPTQPARIVKSREEAKELGVFFRKPTHEEQVKYHATDGVWDWDKATEWRPYPLEQNCRFDPVNPGMGKTVIAKDQPQSSAMVRELVPAVAAAVAQSLQSSGPKAPANIDDKDWKEFLEFRAWQKTQEMTHVAKEEPIPQAVQSADEPSGVDQILETLVPSPSHTNALNAGPQAQESKAEKPEVKKRGRPRKIA